jgi:peptidoglycan/LPS O-acetylase OafA/YrhL
MTARSDTVPIASARPAPAAQLSADGRLPALDGIRAVAVGIVMIDHVGIPLVPGDLGVTLFFSLSGFLITWLLLRERARTGGISLRLFYQRRALRIFPAYLVFVAVSIAVAAALGASWDRVSVVAALTYTINYQNALPGHPSPIPHAWSLAIEEQFYLLWPLLLIALATTRRARFGLLAILAGVCAWRSFLYLALQAPVAYVYNAFDTRFDSIAVGCLLAVLTASPRFAAFLPAVARRPWAPLPVLALLLLSRSGLGPRWHYSLGFLVDSALATLLILQWMELASSRAWGWLDSRVAQWIGRVSYPLYLWHPSAFAWAERLTGSFRGKAAVGLMLSFALAAASYHGIERYFLAVKEHLHPVPERV